MTDLQTIMLIDDNPADNFYHRIIIEESGIGRHIEIFEYANKALDHLQTREIGVDLIFLDINMPRMDGFQFLEAYTQLNGRQKAKVVIIMLTTSLNPVDEARALAYSEVKGWRNKPLTVEMLEEIAETYFQ